MKHSTFKATFRAPYCLFDQPVVVGCSVLAVLCVCVRSLACPGNPSLRCSRFPVGKADIPVLVNQAVPNPLRLQFRKAGFQEAKQKSDVLRGTGVRGLGGSTGTDLCLWYFMRESTITCPWSSFRPPCRQLFEERPSQHPPLAVSLLKQRSSRCQPLVTMAKLNNGRFVNRTMCVCLRPTTAFPPSPLSFPCPH